VASKDLRIVEREPSFATTTLRAVMFSLPSGLLDLFYCLWTNVRRLFRRITRKGLLAPVAKRLNPWNGPRPYAISSYNLSEETLELGLGLDEQLSS